MNLSPATRVWIVAIADYDCFVIKHVCLSEQSAHKRWEEVKQELIVQAQDMMDNGYPEWFEIKKDLENLTLEQSEHFHGERPIIEVYEGEP